MAESAVLYLLSKLESFVGNGIQQERDGHEEWMSLMREFERIKAFLKTADSMEECNEEVKVWVKQVREIAYEAEDVLDEYKQLSGQDHQTEGFLRMIQTSVRNRKARHRLISAMKSISPRIKSICEGQQRLFDGFSTTERGSSSTSSYEDNKWQDHRGDALLVEKSDLVGIEEPKKELVEWLVQGVSQCEVISVVGMGGLGKTTLTKQVYDDPAVKKRFTVRAWVTLSPSLRTEDLLLDMLQQITSSIMKTVPAEAKTRDSSCIRTMIKDLLQKRKSKYLIVLDDVWDMNKWDAVKCALPNNNNGGRIMVTTRKSDLASASGTGCAGKVYNMKPLSAEQSHELFCRKTFKEKACPSHLEEICRHILRKCEGLPLAIVAIGGVLASKDTRRIDEWELVRRSLRSEIEDNEKLKNLKQVLSLSFNDLPYYLKSCFLHLSVFPEAHNVECMRIIRLWVAEGFVERKEGKTLEEVAADYLDELLNRSLIQVAETTSDGRVKMCRVHGLLLEIIISKARDQNYAIIDQEHSELWPERVRRLSVHKAFQVAQQNRSLSHLRSLLMFGVDRSSVDDALSSEFNLLRVLDLCHAPVGRFPVQVLDMNCLRFLSLRSSHIQTIPSSIGNLQNLETLDLKDTHVMALPVEIAKLQRLRHLLVYRYETIAYSHYKYGFKTPADIGALQSLQKLCYIEVDDERNRRNILGLGKLDQLRRLCVLKLRREDGRNLCSSIAKLTNLSSLAVYAFDDEEELDLHHLSSPPPLLQRIFLRGHLQTLPSWIANLHSLVKLRLRMSCLRDDPLESLQNLPSLVHLELLHVYNWQTLRFEAKGFMKLKTLGLDLFDELEFIQVEEGAMPCLGKLIIQRCKLLKDLPLGIEHLKMLKVLEFFDLPDELVQKLKPDEQNEDYQKVAHVPEIRYAYWREQGWDVTSVETSVEEEGSRLQSSSMRSSELPPCWK
ncbi:disease resistance protein RPM1-like [Rhodamnia argentea]|uniref:Disease resistance protein RPM1-like n=1 Tax=Rhodamnia argentea TaxID=178133 RepID=A0A8B8PMS5_9MYRT|nr:disease resistance protein RPM1-like [Rhodamnia argentea]XP_048141495.1 disease resistance protein RPM1-like [Rhodamnia argentea]XP_048141496.1 disease resistance protein RPM1-like [Rhodamnia argentea]XP_048141497.1 disease resistance protein RPM1-like [Rhodamnia argentea]XP_048141498.1 disease resistance protein RPM1-like [Rhodamnia argentea]